jgi:phospholipase/carboxylesterase
MSQPVIVALHGVGSSADDMAAALAPLSAVADVIALPGPEAFDRSAHGRQWFSVRGVTEANRSARTIAALPALLARLDQLAADRNIHRDELTVLGFSQGAIMALAAVAGGYHQGRAIAIAGRLAVPVSPGLASKAELLLIHDADDNVMPSRLSIEAAAALSDAGSEVEVARTAGVGHRIGASTIAAINDWLLTQYAQAAHSSYSLTARIIP